jgi:hypothetical protein
MPAASGVQAQPLDHTRPVVIDGSRLNAQVALKSARSGLMPG